MLIGFFLCALALCGPLVVVQAGTALMTDAVPVAFEEDPSLESLPPIRMRRGGTAAAGLSFARETVQPLINPVRCVRVATLSCQRLLMLFSRDTCGSVK
jgi:hypothetical protein